MNKLINKYKILIFSIIILTVYSCDNAEYSIKFTEENLVNLEELCYSSASSNSRSTRANNLGSSIQRTRNQTFPSFGTLSISNFSTIIQPGRGYGLSNSVVSETHDILYYKAINNDDFEQRNQELPIQLDVSITNQLDFNRVKHTFRNGFVRIFPNTLDMDLAKDFQASDIYKLNQSTYEINGLDSGGAISMDYDIDFPVVGEYYTILYIPDYISILEFYTASGETMDIERYISSFNNNIETHISNGYNFGYFGVSTSYGYDGICEQALIDESINRPLQLQKNNDLFSITQGITNDFDVDIIGYGVEKRKNNNIVGNNNKILAQSADGSPLYYYSPKIVSNEEIYSTNILIKSNPQDEMGYMFYYAKDSTGKIILNSVTKLDIPILIPRYVKYDRNNNPLKIQNIQWQDNGSESESTKWSYVKFFDNYGLKNNSKKFCGDGNYKWQISFFNNQIVDSTQFDSANNFYIGAGQNLSDLQSLSNIISADYLGQIANVKDVNNGLLGADLYESVTSNFKIGYNNLDDRFLGTMNMFFPNISPKQSINNNIISVDEDGINLVIDNFNTDDTTGLILADELNCNQFLFSDIALESIVVDGDQIVISEIEDNELLFESNIDGNQSDKIKYYITTNYSNVIIDYPNVVIRTMDGRYNNQWPEYINISLTIDEKVSLKVEPLECLNGYSINNSNQQDTHNFNVLKSDNYIDCEITIYNNEEFKKYIISPLFGIINPNDLKLIDTTDGISSVNSNNKDIRDFELFSDLDLSSYNQDELPEIFGGNLIGNNHKIKVPSFGLFRVFKGDTIKDLTLEIENFLYPSHPTLGTVDKIKRSVGALIGTIPQDKSSSNKSVNISNITLNIGPPLRNNQATAGQSYVAIASSPNNQSNDPLANRLGLLHYIGGLIGRVDRVKTELNNIAIIGNNKFFIDIATDKIVFGGIIGDIDTQDLIINNSYVDLDVHFTGNRGYAPIDTYFGGLIGTGIDTDIEIFNSFYNGSISTSDKQDFFKSKLVFVGGLLGRLTRKQNVISNKTPLSSIKIENSFTNIPEIAEFSKNIPSDSNDAYRYIGGLIGVVEGVNLGNSSQNYNQPINSVSIKNSYSMIGNYQNIGNEIFGGLIGYLYDILYLKYNYLYSDLNMIDTSISSANNMSLISNVYSSITSQLNLSCDEIYTPDLKTNNNIAINNFQNSPNLVNQIGLCNFNVNKYDNIEGFEFNNEDNMPTNWQRSVEYNKPKLITPENWIFGDIWEEAQK